MWYQLVFLYCAIGASNGCTLASAKVIETTSAYLTEAECRRQAAGVPREAVVENDPRSGFAAVACATRDDIAREVQKSEAALMRRMAPPAETPRSSNMQVAG